MAITITPTIESQPVSGRVRFLQFSNRFAIFSWLIFSVGLGVYTQSLTNFLWAGVLGLLVALSQIDVLSKGFLAALILAGFATAWGTNAHMQTESDYNQYRLMASMMKSGSAGFQQASVFRVKDGKVSKQDFRLMVQDFARGNGVLVSSIHPATVEDRAEFFSLIAARSH